MSAVAFILASFTSPEKICTNPQSMLWLLPLVAAIAVVYKATKVPTIKDKLFLKRGSDFIRLNCCLYARDRSGPVCSDLADYRVIDKSEKLKAKS